MRGQSKKLKNIGKVLQHTWNYDRNLVIMHMFRAITDSVAAVIGVYLSKLIIDELTGEKRPQALAGIVLGASAVICCCHLVGSMVESKAW